ncbi:hypothetical protein SAMN04515674_101159 [Pseudarcicella hirudinis]|uniref:Uncharacterized protein n=2 Tax=Pseudarcicella hirudinis TaxID=1079859 RepID=A0A1I5M6H3_9BACT|nr:hypothetical protein SAMN04515674_101159 [Pseudarcicella hirudinis]
MKKITKQNLLKFILMNLYIVPSVWGQDVIYLKDHTSLACKIQEVSPEKIKYKRPDNPEGPNYSVKTETTLLIISEKGSYLTSAELTDGAVDPTSITEHFNITLNAPSPQYDQIITNSDMLKVTIDQDIDPLIYISQSGESKSIVLSEVLAVLYKDGHHKLIADPEKVAEILTKLKSHETGMKNPAISQADKENSEKTVLAPIQNNMSDIDMGELGMVKFEDYSEKAMAKVREFTNVITILANKETDFNESNKIIEKTIELFLDDKARVEVSSISRPEKKKYLIREYLKRIKLLKYDNVEVSYSNIQYVGKLRKAANGLYYGIVSFEQAFTGYRDGRIVYQDKTVKNHTVVVKVSEEMISGTTSLWWDVFLYDVGVVETKG